jgi:hypothetical protein
MLPAVEEGVRFRAAEDEGRPPTVTDMFEDPGRWGQLAITAFKVTMKSTCHLQNVMLSTSHLIMFTCDRCP